MSASRRRAGLALVAFWAAVMALGAAAPLASAAHVVHELEGSFNGNDEPGGPFGFVFGVALDESGGPGDGDVYVAEVVEDEATGSGLASSVHKFGGDGSYAGVTIDGAEAPGGSFSFVEPETFVLGFQGIAVDNSSGPHRGSLYVADLEHDVVDRFGETGEFLCEISGAPSPPASECNGPSGSATPDGGFAPASLAVDESSGDLYVADAEHAVIDEFNESGAFVRRIADAHVTQPSQIALDSSGNIYVLNGQFFGSENLVKLDAGGNFVSVLDGDEPTAVGVDLADDHVYASHGFGGGIVEYDSAGALIQAFGDTEEAFYPALAVSESSGRIFAGKFGFESSSVDIYTPDTVVPDVLVNPAAEVSETTARLSGAVDPAEGGDVTACRFEYGPAAPYHQTLDCSPAVPYSTGTEVGADLTGLLPSTTYHFRLAAANAGFPPYSKGVFGHSEDVTFVTTGPPTVDEESVAGVERFAANLQAKINPHGFDSEFKFEYVDAEHFEEDGGFASTATRSTASSELGDGTKALAVSQLIAGLQPGTAYHYRAVATNSRGTAQGPDRSFTTLPVAVIKRQWAYVRLASATLEASIEPLGLITSCKVQLVDAARFGRSGYDEAVERPCGKDLGPSAGTAQAEVPGLALDTEYHFRFVATNSSGSLVGEDETFSTFGIEGFSIDLVDEEGHPYTQAGGHPYESITHYAFKHTIVPSGSGSTGSLDGFIKDLLTESPPGRVGGTEATPRCLGHVAEEERCSSDSQVGTITIEAYESGGLNTRTRPLYSVYAPDGVASRFSAIDPYTQTDAHIRTGGDYGTTAGSFNITEEARIVGVTARVWGVPADPSHDPARRCPNGGNGCSSESPPRPLLRNPTTCGGPLISTGSVDSYQGPGQFVTATTSTPAITGCDKVKFEPAIEARPTTDAADSPTGLHVDIHVPQDEDPNDLSVADLRDTTIVPASGLVINPAAADGLVGCTPEQVDLHGPGAANCPDASRVGSVEVDTPLLDHPLHGGIFVAAPHANPFDSLLAIYVVVDDPETGVIVKLAGKIEGDPKTGQLTTGFTDNPQLPFEDFKLDFFGGPRAVLRTPPTCGTFSTRSVLTPWSAPQSGPPATPSDSYRIDAGPSGGPCVEDPAAAPHRPAFHAGTLTPRAGAYSPFVLNLTREDGSQQIADLTVAPPPGLLGRIATIPYCPEAALAAASGRSGEEEAADPSCPASSELGSVDVGAGAGPAPFHVKGHAYLAGPYRGAPLSLAVVVPALAGPYDLGTVVVRAALNVDLETGELSVKSDPIPTILEGISLDVRSIAVSLDRPSFIVNPTSCAQMAVAGGATSVLGQAVSLTDPFRVGSCGRLPFKPRLGLRLFGNVHRGAHSSLRAVLRMPRRGIDIARASVTLPPSQFLDNEHIRSICTRRQFAEDACPHGSVYGHAAAWSPLLDKPLRGPVYLRSSHHRLPDLLADLRGQIRFALDGRVDSALGGIRVNIEDVPDAPVSKFVLKMRGRAAGLLQNSVNMCAKPQAARVELEGHDGRIKVLHPRLRAQCRRGKR